MSKRGPCTEDRAAHCGASPTMELRLLLLGHGPLCPDGKSLAWSTTERRHPISRIGPVKTNGCRAGSKAFGSGYRTASTPGLCLEHAGRCTETGGASGQHGRRPCHASPLFVGADTSLQQKESTVWCRSPKHSALTELCSQLEATHARVSLGAPACFRLRV